MFEILMILLSVVFLLSGIVFINERLSILKSINHLWENYYRVSKNSNFSIQSNSLNDNLPWILGTLHDRRIVIRPIILPFNKKIITEYAVEFFRKIEKPVAIIVKEKRFIIGPKYEYSFNSMSSDLCDGKKRIHIVTNHPLENKILPYIRLIISEYSNFKRLFFDHGVVFLDIEDSEIKEKTIVQCLNTFTKGIEIIEKKWSQDNGVVNKPLYYSKKRIRKVMNKIAYLFVEGRSWQENYFDRLEKQTENRVVSIIDSTLIIIIGVITLIFPFISIYLLRSIEFWWLSAFSIIGGSAIIFGILSIFIRRVGKQVAKERAFRNKN